LPEAKSAKRGTPWNGKHRAYIKECAEYDALTGGTIQNFGLRRE
jgi:hypothetical protein